MFINIFFNIFEVWGFKVFPNLMNFSLNNDVPIFDQQMEPNYRGKILRWHLAFDFSIKTFFKSLKCVF